MTDRYAAVSELLPAELPPLHARYEADVVASGWLEGSLKPRPTPKPTRDERRAAELERARAALVRWERKAKRAANAIRKARAKIRRLERLTTAH